MQLQQLLRRQYAEDESDGDKVDQDVALVALVVLRT
jgi:hypothetical protein